MVVFQYSLDRHPSGDRVGGFDGGVQCLVGDVSSRGVSVGALYGFLGDVLGFLGEVLARSSDHHSNRDNHPD